MVKDFFESLYLSAKLIGLMPVAALGTVAALTTLAINPNAGAQDTLFTPLLEIILPVLTAVLWGYVAAPPADPCLEVLITYRLRLSYVRLTRLVVLLLEVLVVAVLYSLIAGLRSGDAVGSVLLGVALLVRPLLLFMGLTGLVTILLTNAALGLSVLSVVVIVCLLMLGMWEYLRSIDLLALIFPFLYSATHSLSAVNGVIVSAVGLALTGLSLVLPLPEAGLFHSSPE